MNLFAKKCIKFSLIILTIGIVITIIALSLGGRFVQFPVKNLTDMSQTYSGVESLNINLAASEVEVKIGNDFKIEANNISNDTFKSYVQNGKWYIEDKMTSKIFNFNNYNSKIIIYVPESFSAKELKINLGAGKLVADKLSGITTDIDVGAGDLKMYDLQTDDINIDCGVGNVEINGIVNNKGYVKCGIGNVMLNLKGNEKDYNYNLSLGIGEVTLNDNSFGGIGNKVIDNTSQGKSFKVECGIGKVSLNIK